MKTLKQELFLQDNDVLQKAPQQFMQDLEKQTKEPLTDLEKQIAILIRAGFTGKEMPALLYRTDSHLRHVRADLKDKLPIPAETNLKTYLQAL
jgi:helix-turn-helix protein